MKLASLPWYDLPEVRWATDALWEALAGELRRAGVERVPGELNRNVHYEQQWSSPDFLFGQACGYDVHIAYADCLTLVATPCYAADGCRGGTYRSFVVVRADSPYRRLEDLRGGRCVINTPTSHSGMNVLRALVAPLHERGRFFSRVHVSGAHERSLRMIGNGEADVAAIDCVTHALLTRHRPAELAGTRVLSRTRRVAAPPYVTAATTPPETLARLRTALLRVMQTPSLQPARRALLLDRVQVLSRGAYQPIQQLEEEALHCGYHEIAAGRR